MSCTSLREAVLNMNCGILELNLFNGCTSLQSVTIADYIRGISAYAFEDCVSLQSIELPDTIRFIGVQAFAGAGLRSITIPGCVETISEEMFGENSKLKSVVIEDGVQKIEDCAFIYCGELQSLTIPESVTDIAQNILEGNTLAIVYGKSGSAAQSYATNSRHVFVDVTMQDE